MVRRCPFSRQSADGYAKIHYNDRLKQESQQNHLEKAFSYLCDFDCTPLLRGQIMLYWIAGNKATCHEATKISYRLEK